ncbi:MAG: hypothetical protein JWM59_366 [Verrucomicrobiales bacterium]|nr:hypothetical protein [Verrucomicrobiales bacterium]
MGQSPSVKILSCFGMPMPNSPKLLAGKILAGIVEIMGYSANFLREDGRWSKKFRNLEFVKGKGVLILGYDFRFILNAAELAGTLFSGRAGAADCRGDGIGAADAGGAGQGIQQRRGKKLFQRVALLIVVLHTEQQQHAFRGIQQRPVELQLRRVPQPVLLRQP